MTPKDLERILANNRNLPDGAQAALTAGQLRDLAADLDVARLRCGYELPLDGDASIRCAMPHGHEGGHYYRHGSPRPGVLQRCPVVWPLLANVMERGGRCQRVLGHDNPHLFTDPIGRQVEIDLDVELEVSGG